MTRTSRAVPAARSPRGGMVATTRPWPTGVVRRRTRLRAGMTAAVAAVPCRIWTLRRFRAGSPPTRVPSRASANRIPRLSRGPRPRSRVPGLSPIRVPSPGPLRCRPRTPVGTADRMARRHRTPERSAGPRRSRAFRLVRRPGLRRSPARSRARTGRRRRSRVRLRGLVVGRCRSRAFRLVRSPELRRSRARSRVRMGRRRTPAGSHAPTGHLRRIRPLSRVRMARRRRSRVRLRGLVVGRCRSRAFRLVRSPVLRRSRARSRVRTGRRRRSRVRSFARTVDRRRIPGAFPDRMPRHHRNPAPCRRPVVPPRRWHPAGAGHARRTRCAARRRNPQP